MNQLQQQYSTKIKLSFNRVVALHPEFRRVVNLATAVVFLSQAYYLTINYSDSEGWFSCSMQDWTSSTSLTEYEQRTIRRKLREIGVLQEKQAIGETIYYKLNLELIYELIEKGRGEEITRAATQQQEPTPVQHKPLEVVKAKPTPSEIRTGGGEHCSASLINREDKYSLTIESKSEKELNLSDSDQFQNSSELLFEPTQKLLNWATRLRPDINVYRATTSFNLWINKPHNAARFKTSYQITQRWKDWIKSERPHYDCAAKTSSTAAQPMPSQQQLAHYKAKEQAATNSLKLGSQQPTMTNPELHQLQAELDRAAHIEQLQDKLWNELDQDKKELMIKDQVKEFLSSSRADLYRRMDQDNLIQRASYEVKKFLVSQTLC